MEWGLAASQEIILLVFGGEFEAGRNGGRGPPESEDHRSNSETDLQSQSPVARSLGGQSPIPLGTNGPPTMRMAVVAGFSHSEAGQIVEAHPPDFKDLKLVSELLFKHQWAIAGVSQSTTAEIRKAKRLQKYNADEGLKRQLGMPRQQCDGKLAAGRGASLVRTSRMERQPDDSGSGTPVERRGNHTSVQNGTGGSDDSGSDTPMEHCSNHDRWVHLSQPDDVDDRDFQGSAVPLTDPVAAEAPMSVRARARQVLDEAQAARTQTQTQTIPTTTQGSAAPRGKSKCQKHYQKVGLGHD